MVSLIGIIRELELESLTISYLDLWLLSLLKIMSTNMLDI